MVDFSIFDYVLFIKIGKVILNRYISIKHFSLYNSHYLPLPEQISTEKQLRNSIFPTASFSMKIEDLNSPNRTGLIAQNKSDFS